MPICKCENCGGDFHWKWEEAFDKFGFNDGEGQIETWQVVNVLSNAGYKAEAIPYGLHNITIDSIKKDGVELMPKNSDIGYDDPCGYLPPEIIALLDKELP